MRKWIKRIYFLIVLIGSRIFQVNTIRNNRIVYFASFTEDLLPIIKELNQQTNYEVILFYHPRIEQYIQNIPITKKFKQSNAGVLNELFYFSTSKWIIVDTYYLIFNGIKKRKSQKIIQTWHAAGALKKFGLEDQALVHATDAEIKQFKKVYNSFDYVLTGSEIMGDIFKSSFGIHDDQLLKIGLPRLDQYSDIDAMNRLRKKYKEDLQIPKEKLLLLYVPTFREYELSIAKIPIDFSQLNEEWAPLVKLHPAVRMSQFIDFITAEDTTKLMIAADVVITDYSSLAMEASFLQKPVLFFAYDFEDYNEKKGLIDKYDKAVNNQIYDNEASLLHALNTKEYELSIEMNRIWNEYNKGNAAEKLVNIITETNNDSSML